MPGYEAPVNLAYSSRNRSAACRIPVSGSSPKAKRLEFRCPDPTTNPYLAFAAMMMAGLDGIQSKTSPGQPLDKDIYALSPEELKDVPKAPGSLEESLGNLKKDHAYLRKGDVFTQDVDRRLGRVEGRERDQAGPPAADHARVRPLLRQLSTRPTRNSENSRDRLVLTVTRHAVYRRRPFVFDVRRPLA